MFITFEGGEGAGKSTQARLLVEALGRSGREIVPTREPGGSPGAETLRALLLSREQEWSPSAEIYLHFAARTDHLARTILPALQRGAIVVCDRFADSTMAYQGYGLGADRTLIATLTALLPVQPTVTVVLQVTPAVSAQRIVARHRALDRYEAMDAGFHARVAEGFGAIAAAEPDRCVVIDADRPMEAVHRAALAAVQARL